MLSIPTAKEIVLSNCESDNAITFSNEGKFTRKMAIASKRLIRERCYDLMDEETRVRALKTLKQLDCRFPE